MDININLKQVTIGKCGKKTTYQGINGIDKINEDSKKEYSEIISIQFKSETEIVHSIKFRQSTRKTGVYWLKKTGRHHSKELEYRASKINSLQLIKGYWSKVGKGIRQKNNNKVNIGHCQLKQLFCSDFRNKRSNFSTRDCNRQSVRNVWRETFKARDSHNLQTKLRSLV